VSTRTAEENEGINTLKNRWLCTAAQDKGHEKCSAMKAIELQHLHGETSVYPENPCNSREAEKVQAEHRRGSSIKVA
jgi:hypothetical protein